MSVSLDELERRQAFTGLLATPVVSPHANPGLWALVRRHRPTLAQWFRDRLGYRLVVSPAGARLYRPPLDTGVIAPSRPRPGSRRILVLALLAADRVRAPRVGWPRPLLLLRPGRVGAARLWLGHSRSLDVRDGPAAGRRERVRPAPAVAPSA